MSGISVGASGETADDMRTSGFEAKEALLITSIVRVGEGVQCVHHSSSPRKRGPITTVVQYLRRQLAACRTRRHGVWVPAFAGTTQSYFFVLVSAGFSASGFASALAAVSSGLFLRSTLAASRSLVT